MSAVTRVDDKALTAIRERVAFLSGALPENQAGKDSVVLLAEVDWLRSRIKELADELVREMTANIPLSAPDRDYDPNDEFKRCAVDRAERVKRWRDTKVQDLLNPKSEADS